MSEAQHYSNLLKIGQITPTAVEKKLKDLMVELDDSKFFGKSSEIIKSLETRIKDLQQILVLDSAAVVNLESPKTTFAPKQEIEEERLITELYDGTQLNEVESRELGELLKQARKGSITKTTLLESLLGLELTIANASRKLGPNDPAVQTLLFKKVLLQHVIMHGSFPKYHRRRNPDETLRELERKAQADPTPENRHAYSRALIRTGSAPCQVCDPLSLLEQAAQAEQVCDKCGSAICSDCVVVCPCGRPASRSSDVIICKICQEVCGGETPIGCGKTLCEWCKLSCNNCDIISCEDCLQYCAAKIGSSGRTCHRSLCRDCRVECNYCGEYFCEASEGGCSALCSDCGEAYCANCVFTCPACKKIGCPSETFKCEDCDYRECRKCTLSGRVGSSMNYCGEVCEQIFCDAHRCEHLKGN